MTAAEISGDVLLAMVVVLLVARFMGWALSKVGQPRVNGEILGGIVLGPSLLGIVWPEAFDALFPPEVVTVLKVLAQLGVVLFMFLVGLELDLSALRGQGHRAVVISHTSILVPMLLGSLLGLWLYPRLGGGVDELGFVLFLGAAMAITAFPVLARVLQETGLYGTRLGVLVLACAAVDDVTAWCVLAVVVAIVSASGAWDAVLTIVLTGAFLLLMFTVVRSLLARLKVPPVWFAITFALASAWLTGEIGVHAIFGAFMAGAVMPRHRGYERMIPDQLRAATNDLLLPVFFVVVGLATRIELIDSAYLWGITVLVIVVAIAGKWGGSMLAARLVGENWRDAASIGVLMNTRGLTEIVILTVGLEIGVITPTVFTIMVIMALVTTFMAVPTLGLVSAEDPNSMTKAAGDADPDPPKLPRSPEDTAP